jgi:hypothetical protein
MINITSRSRCSVITLIGYSWFWSDFQLYRDLFRMLGMILCESPRYTKILRGWYGAHERMAWDWLSCTVTYSARVCQPSLNFNVLLLLRVPNECKCDLFLNWWRLCDRFNPCLCAILRSVYSDGLSGHQAMFDKSLPRLFNCFLYFVKYYIMEKFGTLNAYTYFLHRRCAEPSLFFQNLLRNILTLNAYFSCTGH